MRACWRKRIKKRSDIKEDRHQLIERKVDKRGKG